MTKRWIFDENVAVDYIRRLPTEADATREGRITRVIVYNTVCACDCRTAP